MEVKRYPSSIEDRLLEPTPDGDIVFYADHAAAMAEKDRELADTRAALAAVRAQLEAEPRVLEVARKTIEELGATVKRMRKAAHEMLRSLDANLGIARLSDDNLRWECPECHQVMCDPDTCGKGNILRAADALQVALADPAPKQNTEGE